jgi:hypothetical protein
MGINQIRKQIRVGDNWLKQRKERDQRAEVMNKKQKEFAKMILDPDYKSEMALSDSEIEYYVTSKREEKKNVENAS